jgi:hypothetical protein
VTDPSSRHAGLPTYRCVLPGRGEVELFEPRVRTPPPAERLHPVVGSDRLDLLAYRYLGDPHLYWRIADANADADLRTLAQPGRLLRIPGRSP